MTPRELKELQNDILDGVSRAALVGIGIWILWGLFAPE